MKSKENDPSIEQLHVFGIHIPRRTIYMGSEDSGPDGESGTDAKMAEKATKNLFLLSAISDEPITIITNNVGGDVTHGMALYDAIHECVCYTTIIVLGQASSMGSVILQAADRRLMSPNAIQLLHFGQAYVSGEALTVYKTVKENKRVDQWMLRMYLKRITEKHPKYTIPKVNAMLSTDTYLTAKESVDMGLADGIWCKV